MKADQATILKELRKTEAMASEVLERCCKIRRLMEGEVSTSPEVQHLKSVAASAVAGRRARKK